MSNNEVNYKEQGSGEKNMDLRGNGLDPDKGDLDLREDGGPSVHIPPGGPSAPSDVVPGYAPPAYYHGDNAMNESLDHPQVVRAQVVPQPRPQAVVPPVSTPVVSQGISPLPEKGYVAAYLMTIPFGFLGMQHFYLNRPAVGAVYFWTLGLFGVGWLVDWFRMPWLVMQANKDMRMNTQRPRVQTRNLLDAYVFWLPFGIFGFHHYYLKNYKTAVCYTFTLGFFGIGWLVDLFRMPSLVKTANKYMQVQHEIHGARKFRTCDAYVLGASPLGFLGAHHYYLERYSQGVFYTCTFGGFGIGWLIDLCRIHFLVKRANKISQEKDFRLQIDQPRYTDDAYVFWLPPLGLIGMHHYYMGRYVWGALYTFTLGLFGIGWMIDLCRMPCLVKGANVEIKERRRAVMEEIGVVEAEHGETVTVATVSPAVTVVPVELGVQNQNGTKQLWELHMYNNHALESGTATDPHGILPTMPPSYDSIVTEVGGTRVIINNER